MRADGPTEGVVVQPGVAKSVKREIGGKTIYFCCEGCASYFSSHVAEVSALRGLTLS